MGFGPKYRALFIALIIGSLGACTKGQIGEKISGETFVLAGGKGSILVLRNPTEGAVLTSRFGTRKHPLSGKVTAHRGVDLAAETGTPVLAAADGTVFFQGEKGSFGNFVMIQHNEHVVTSYAHLNDFEPKMFAGKPVKKGEVIGFIGTTGRSSGPHLHYEVAVDGKEIDPLGFSGTKIVDDVNKGVEKAAEDVSNWVQQVRESISSETTTK
ncbi:MAG: M23 family metallopeptidase [Geminicoccaceae bacterium]